MVNLNILGILAVFILPSLITLFLSAIFLQSDRFHRIGFASLATALIGAALPSIIIASGFSLSGVEPGIFERTIVFVATIVVLTLIPSWPLAYWIAKRHKNANVIDPVVFD